jgi:hypothetical protein
VTTTYTLTGKFADLIGVAIGGRKIRAWLDTNVATLGLVDLDNNLIKPPKPVRINVADDGSFSVVAIATNSTGINILDGSLRYIVRAELPDGNGRTIPWDSGYFTLTGNADLSDKVNTSVAVPVSDATTMVATLVEQAVQDHTPGIELGYASRTSNITSTATTAAGATALTGLSVTVTGQGRPVDLRFHCAAVYHSVANTLVSIVIVRDGNVTGADNQMGAVASASTSTGPSLAVARRTATLVAGTPYTFTVRAWGAAAGTCTLVSAAYCPTELVVTSR